jgi:hypothetical protein
MPASWILARSYEHELLDSRVDDGNLSLNVADDCCLFQRFGRHLSVVRAALDRACVQSSVLARHVERLSQAGTVGVSALTCRKGHCYTDTMSLIVRAFGLTHLLCLRFESHSPLGRQQALHPPKSDAVCDRFKCMPGPRATSTTSVPIGTQCWGRPPTVGLAYFPLRSLSNPCHQKYKLHKNCCESLPFVK